MYVAPAIKMEPSLKFEFQEVQCPLSTPNCLHTITADLVNVSDSHPALERKGAYIWKLCTLYTCVHYSLIMVKIS